jgi:hypothetical protein
MIHQASVVAHLIENRPLPDHPCAPSPPMQAPWSTVVLAPSGPSGNTNWTPIIP